MEAIDLFAGPGGWDVALSVLGVDPLGIEWDDAACATRDAAGLRTLQADIAKLDPEAHIPAGGYVELLLASPPCPTFSRAGKGDGIADMPLVYEAATAAARGKPVPPLPWRDERSALVVEPLRWAVLLEPRFLAWEQVPDVLPFWEHCAELLRRKGWNVWTGVMEAERYGVPQTRERAILMADREQPVHPPKPTHQRYVKGEPQRHEVTMDGEILPWVSMAEALGWVEGVEPSPAPTVSGERDEDEPAFTVATNADRWKFRNGNRENAAERAVDRPAPTLHFGGRSNKVDWVRERPATTVAGDPRISKPGRHDPEEPGSQQKDAIRVTLEEAAILQSFPPDYPFQGSKSARFTQVGNAVPPLLAHAILSALLVPVLEAERKVAA